MAKKRKVIDKRVPRPHDAATFEQIMGFLNGMPTRATNLYEIKPTETKTFAKVSADGITYIKDVVGNLTLQPTLVRTHVLLENVKNASIAGEQYRAIAALLTNWATAYTRNAAQAEAYAYQQSSIYENDVDTAIDGTVVGAQMIKDTLVANRESRNRKSAATRAANAKTEAKILTLVSPSVP